MLKLGETEFFIFFIIGFKIAIAHIIIFGIESLSVLETDVNSMDNDCRPVDSKFQLLDNNRFPSFANANPPHWNVQDFFNLYYIIFGILG